MLRPVSPGEVPAATASLAWRVHPRGTDEMRVRDALGPLFADGDFVGGRFAGMFPERGQPGLSPALLAMVTVLQFLHHLSDREAVAAVADRISWKYALGLELDDPGFDASVLCEFRDRLAEPDRADGLLEIVLDRLKAAGLIRAQQAARTDSTHVIAAVRQLNRVEHCGESLRAALEEIARIRPDWVVPLLDAGWHHRYGRKVETARLLGRGSGKTTMAKLAAVIGADGAALLARIDADPAAGWMNALPQVAHLRLMWDQQYRPGPGGLRLRDAAELPPSAVRPQSPYDTDARWSTKSGGDITWVGSKAHLTETCDDDLPKLVVDVHTTAATDPDVTATAPIGDKLAARGLTPAVHLMDSGYPSAAGLVAAAARGTAVITPFPQAGSRSSHAGVFTPSQFTIDWDTGTATCPNGAVSVSARPEKRGLVNFTFSQTDCGPCPIRRKCTLAKPPAGRRLNIHPAPLHTAQTTVRTAEHHPDWQRQYNKRAGIEGTVSQAVRGPDLRHARYRGLPRTHIQNIACGIAINITRLGAHYASTRPAPRPPTRIHHLCLAHGIITEP